MKNRTQNEIYSVLPGRSIRVGAEDANEPGAKRDRMRFAGRVFPMRKIGGSCKTLRNGRRMVCGRRSEGVDRSERSGPCLFHIYLFLPDSAGPVLLRPVRSRPVRLGPFEDRRSAGSSREGRRRRGKTSRFPCGMRFVRHPRKGGVRRVYSILRVCLFGEKDDDGTHKRGCLRFARQPLFAMVRRTVQWVKTRPSCFSCFS